MTLEKLLIFGFAIAVVTALAVSGRTMVENREPGNDAYRAKTEALLEKTK
jgi:hypothetical protein